METAERVRELEDMADQVAQAAARIGQVERELPDGGIRERLRQVRAQLEMALNEDHVWLGGSSYTLAASIDEIRGMGRRKVTVKGGPTPVELEAWPEHGVWYEPGHADEIGALWAPMAEDGSPPSWEEVGEIEVRHADA